jgi:hypothetical protein
MLATTEPAAGYLVCSGKFRRTFQIGAVTAAICGSSDEVCSSEALSDFECNAPTSHIEAEVQWVDGLRRHEQKADFDSGALWRMWKDGSEAVFDFTSSRLGSSPYKRVCAGGDFTNCRILLNRAVLGGYRSPSPLEYPADELLFTNYLAHHGLGVEVHGGGLIDPDHGGFLFLGHSGAGKSTTTRLWKSSRDPEILSDDRIILRLHDGELWMYGTPWHGEAAYASPAKEKLSKIFILQHGQGNHFREMGKVEAAGELFARTFPPFHSAQGLESTVEFLSRVVHTVPCYEFQFLPDRSAVDSVLHFNG